MNVTVHTFSICRNNGHVISTSLALSYTATKQLRLVSDDTEVVRAEYEMRFSQYYTHQTVMRVICE